MTTARKVEELDIWTASRGLVKEIYVITAAEHVRRDSAFCDQVRRAAISVMSNIAEGFGRFSDKEFARYLDIARGSVIETHSLLYVAVDAKYIERKTFNRLTEMTSKLVAQLTVFGQYLRNKRDRKTSVADN